MESNFTKYSLVVILILGLFYYSSCTRVPEQPSPNPAIPTPVQSEEIKVPSPPSAGQAKAEAKGEEKVDLPKDPRAYRSFLLAQAFQLNGETAKALKAYQDALTYDPNSPVIETEIAAISLKQGKIEEARNLCKQALTLNPNS